MVDKAREMRLRRRAEMAGLRLVKSRRRTAGAIGFQCWCLTSWGQRVAVLVPGGFKLVHAPRSKGGALRYASWVTLDVIEHLLCSPVEPQEEAMRPSETWLGEQ